jgi:hypothetical protein
MEEKLFRKEWKHIITPTQYHSIRNELETYLKPDRQDSGRGYTVRSLYFDTLDLKDLQANLDGIMRKCKLRLRTYPGSEDVYKLELKCKNGSDSTKQFMVLTRDEAHRIITSESAFLLTKKDPLAVDFYQRLHRQIYRPAILVEYNREAYAYPYNHIRITYDTQVRASRIKESFFDEHPVGRPVLSPNTGILEVKYDGALPDHLARIIRKIDSRAQAYSKYAQSQLNFLP